MGRKEYLREYYKRNREKALKKQAEYSKKKGLVFMREANKKSAKKRAEDLYKLMGYKCVCCGITDSIYFNVDHVDNDGYLERNKGKASKRLTASEYLKNPKKYQLLCANCNHAKHKNGGKLYKPKKRQVLGYAYSHNNGL